jgi:L-alanine-DL-glutamate epimerase-like enolase superfamily enzyme
MRSRSESDGRAATLASPNARALTVVIVEDVIDERLAGHGGCRYSAPAQPLAQARELIRLVLGSDAAPADRGPWRRTIAGGQRVVRLEPWSRDRR